MTNEISPLCFIDTEFTNLDPRLGDVVEAAWAVDLGEINSILFPHTLEHATQEALAVNRYYERRLDRWATTAQPTNIPRLTAPLVEALTGATIVAENYGIDCAKLLTKIGFEPWHYRKIELSSVAMTVFDLERPESQHKTAARLRDRGFLIPEADHSAGGDVACLRACYYALREIQASR